MFNLWKFIESFQLYRAYVEYRSKFPGHSFVTPDPTTVPPSSLFPVPRPHLTHFIILFSNCPPPSLLPPPPLSQSPDHISLVFLPVVTYMQCFLHPVPRPHLPFVCRTMLSTSNRKWAITSLASDTMRGTSSTRSRVCWRRTGTPSGTTCSRFSKTASKPPSCLGGRRGLFIIIIIIIIIIIKS